MGNKFKNILFLFKRTWKLNKSYFLIEFISTVCNLYLTYIQIIIPSLLLNELAGEKRLNVIYKDLFILVISFIICKILNCILQYFNIRSNMKITNEFGNQISYEINNMDYAHCESNKVLNLVQRFYFGIQPENFVQCLNQIVMYLCQIFFSCVLFFYIDWYMLLFVLIFIFAQKKLISILEKNELMWDERKAPYRRKMDYFNIITRNYDYGKDVRIFQAKHMLDSCFEKILKKYEISFSKYVSKRIKNNCFTCIIDVIQQAVFYFYFILKTINNNLLIGDLNLLLSLSANLQASIIGGLDSLKNLSVLSQYVDEYKSYIELTKKEDEKKGENNLEEYRGYSSGERVNLFFENVTFQYPGSDINILENISFVIDQGEKVAFVGVNGAGKTTLVKLICRFYQPTSGHIYLNDKDINDYQYNDYVKYLSVLFQDYKLLALTIEDNICMAKQRYITDIYKCIERSDLTDFVGNLEDKIKTWIYKDFSDYGIELSGGNAQKLAFAREMYKDGEIFILDEPTSSMDPITEHDFYQLIMNEMQGKTIILISHRLYSVKYADCIYVLDNGRIIENGNHEFLMKKNGKYAEMFAMQSEMYNG